MSEVKLDAVLETLREFDRSGGASLDLVAWELFLEPPDVSRAWTYAVDRELIRPAGVDQLSGEQLWRLTFRGWTRLGRRREQC